MDRAPPSTPHFETLRYSLVFSCMPRGKCRYSHEQKPFRPSPFFRARDFFDQFLSTTEDGFFFQLTTESLTGGDAMSGCEFLPSFRGKNIGNFVLCFL